MIAAELTSAQLLIAGLLSGGSVVGLILKWLVNSPEREAEAYRQGVSDEGHRSEEECSSLKQTIDEQHAEILKLRGGLLTVAVASNLGMAQRIEIALALGWNLPTPTATSLAANGETAPTLGAEDVEQRPRHSGESGAQ